jgi:Do/DeqQ family serine protease
MHINFKSRTVSVLTLAVVAGALLIFAFSAPWRSSTAAAAPQSPAAVRVSPLAPQSYADVVDRVAPAVVTIHAARRVRASQQSPFLDDPLFRQFFGNPNGVTPRNNPSTLEQALGSGVIVSADGHIITNHHVIDGAEQISVDLSDKRTFQAKVIGSDDASDLAILKIEATNLPVLTLGNSDKVRVGDVCLAVGNPLGIGQTVTMGIISAKGRATAQGDGSFEDFLQTDAAINQGNSGGALVDARGELIGINSQILSPSGGNIGIGFAIPSNMARNVMDQLIKNGKVSRGKLGVVIQDITADLAKSLNLNQVTGVLINSVDAGSPAEKAGVQIGDVITAVNGSPVADGNALRNQIGGTAPGTEVALTILRNGKEMQVHARLTELAPGNQAAASSGGGSESGGGQLGITVQPVTPALASRLKLPGTEGVVVTDVQPGSPAADAGIQPDDVILQVNRQPVKSGADVRAGVQASGSRPTLLLINRNGSNVFMAVQGK